MSQVLKSDRDRGVTVVGQSVYFSLGSPLWKNLTGSIWAPATYDYSPPGGGWADGEMATMNMAAWSGKGEWYSARMRLDVALGFGKYEQSVKVGVGAGVTTTFYLSEPEVDRQQEIDFEFSGHCSPGANPCGTQFVWTNVWWAGNQFANATPLWVGTPPTPLPDSTSGWGFSVYRYMIDWEPNTVTWSVDRTGSGNNYTVIRTQDMATIGIYDESLCRAFISFWSGWSPDGSTFRNGQDAPGKCGASGACYQAFYFQSLKFTPSANNRLVSLA